MTAFAASETQQILSFVQESPFGSGIMLNLSVFDGPMDLLLYLIKREEVDVFNIPIAFIAQEYLKALELMHSCDLEIGGEFLVLAATLLTIKARLLLPRQTASDGEEIEDPRRDLVLRILEYQTYKKTAELLRSYEEKQSQFFPRESITERNATAEDEPLQVTLFDLLLAFQSVMGRLRAEKPHYDLYLPQESLDQRMEYLRGCLRQRKKWLFSNLAHQLSTRLALILTFLAILELVRIGEIALKGVSDADFIIVAKRL